MNDVLDFLDENPKSETGKAWKRFHQNYIPELNRIEQERKLKMIKKTQLIERKKGIGGTDAGGILGVSPYSTPLSVYLSKTEDIQTPENEHMRWGNILEPIVADEFSRQTGFKLFEPTQIYRDHECSFLVGNPDRIIKNEDAGLEIKTGSIYTKHNWEGKIPDHYMCQCQHYMMITGLPKWYLAVLLGNSDFSYYVIDRSDDFIQMMRDREIKFWNEHVVPQKPPSVSDLQVDADMLKILYPGRAEKLEIYLPHRAESLIERYYELQTSKKEVDAEMKQITNDLKMEMKDAEKGITDSSIVTWSRFYRETFDYKGFFDAYPRLKNSAKAKPFFKSTASDRLTIAKKKGS